MQCFIDGTIKYSTSTKAYYSRIKTRIKIQVIEYLHNHVLDKTIKPNRNRKIRNMTTIFNMKRILGRQESSLKKVCWKLCFLGIIQNSFQHDIHPNEKSIIQHNVLFTWGEKKACYKSLQVLRRKKNKERKKKSVVTSDTVKGSSGRDRWVVKDAEETHANYMALTTTCDITHPDQHKFSKTKNQHIFQGASRKVSKSSFCLFWWFMLIHCSHFLPSTVHGTIEI